MSTRVSIIVTSYNRPKMLGWTIESALRQTYKNTEVIIVDAGSDAQAKHIGESLASRKFFQEGPHARVEFYEGEPGSLHNVSYIQLPNTGIADARNMGVNAVATRYLSGGPDTVQKICTGDAIVFLDDDNWIEPTYIEKTVALMTEGVGIVTTDMHVFSSTGDSIVKAYHAVLNVLKDGNAIHSSSLISREAFNQSGGNKKDVYEDWELWLNILSLGWNLRVVNEPLFHYRHVESSLITRHAERHEERINNMKALHPEIYG